MNVLQSALTGEKTMETEYTDRRLKLDNSTIKMYNHKIILMLDFSLFFLLFLNSKEVKGFPVLVFSDVFKATLSSYELYSLCLKASQGMRHHCCLYFH